MKNKILIIAPNLTRPGGVSSLFTILELNKYESIEYFLMNSTSKLSLIRKFVDTIYMYASFFVKCFSYNVIHVNPSLNFKSYIRDCIFVFISKILNKKVLIYWHGWDREYEIKINGSYFLKTVFKLTYHRADMHIVLGKCFKSFLQEYGVLVSKIKIESNAASDNYIDHKNGLKIFENKSVINLLFIARIEKEKGIYESLKTLELLINHYNVHLNIAGSGSESTNIKSYILEHNLSDFVTIFGNITKEDKHMVLTNSDILLLPTTHNEGMPISILEAMLYGLPVISRNVGGIPDWVENVNNGYLFSKNDPEEYAECIGNLIKQPALFAKISSNNMNKAKRNFTPQVVSKRLCNYYQEALSQ